MSFAELASSPLRFDRPGRLAAGALLPGQCSAINSHVPVGEERTIGTDGVIARYHDLLNTPFRLPLTQTGYVVGIEKSPRAPIGFTDPDSAQPTEGADTARLVAPRRLPPGGQRDLDQQRATFARLTGEPKVMFVSHILGYRVRAGGGVDPDLVYSAYGRTAFGESPDGGAGRAAYSRGWAALDDLEARIAGDIARAAEGQAPFTHLLLLSMGWNNDQFESLARYNAILQHTRRAGSAEGARFNPLVIGLTWPSVWGGTSVFDLANRAAHLGSYTVKAGDADEIGYGLANHMVNAMLPRLEAASGLQSILLGHSMGARILTRAYYSADLLKGAVPRRGPAPLVIGLQAAFSANRFRSGFRLVPGVRALVSGEGGPYQEQAAPGGTVILTWSRHDRANPIARVATGAAHVGGSAGAAIMASPELSDRVLSARWQGPEALAEACGAARDTGKVLHLDATPIVASHNDIVSPVTGRLVWTAIRCAAPPPA